MRTLAEVAVIRAEEEPEVQGIQAAQETQGDPVVLEALIEAKGEMHEAQFSIRWLFVWKG